MLDVDAASSRSGAPVQQYTANGGSNQLWYFQSAPNGGFVIRNFQSNLALEIGGDSTLQGAKADQWVPLNQANQYWTLTAVG